MKTIILGRQMNVWNDFKVLIEGKLEKLDKYFADEAEATVTLSKKRNLRNIEVTIISGGTIFRSEEGAESFQNAIDEAIESLERQIRKNKTRLEKRLRSGAFEIAADDMDEEEEGEFSIRTKTFPIKPMSVEEAILQMNLLEHQFFMFRDAETNEPCVVYRRKAGDYGLIVAEE